MNPVFVEIEDYVGGGSSHGAGGPLHVDSPLNEISNLTVFLEAFSSIGYNEATDYTSGSLPVPSMNPVKLMRTPAGYRLDAYTAFIAPLLAAGNSRISVRSSTKATKILFNTNSVSGSSVAYGAEFVSNGHTRWMAYAQKEVIVSAGVFSSPKLLHLSGIGATADLVSINITQRVALPQVGQNLIARPLNLVGYTGTMLLPEQDLTSEADSSQIFQFLGGGGGWFATPIAGALGYGPASSAPQARFVMHLTTVQPNFLVPFPTAVGVGCALSFPASRGSVKARSSNPFDFPVVDSGMYSNTADLQDMIECVTTTRSITGYPAILEVLGTEFLPGASYDATTMGPALMSTYRFSYHAFSSNRMGTDATDSVVDDHLLVHGFENLRIVDGSVLPAPVSTGPSATVYMLGWRAASIIADANYVADLNNGFNVCATGGFSIILDLQTYQNGAAACESLGKTTFALKDTTSCVGQSAIQAMTTCGVPQAYFRNCKVLDQTSTSIESNIGCLDMLPTICVNINLN